MDDLGGFPYFWFNTQMDFEIVFELLVWNPAASVTLKMGNRSKSLVMDLRKAILGVV